MYYTAFRIKGYILSFRQKYNNNLSCQLVTLKFYILAYLDFRNVFVTRKTHCKVLKAQLSLYNTFSFKLPIKLFILLF